MEACTVEGFFVLPNNTQLFDNVQEFGQKFRQIYPYLAACICISGIILNLLMITVLTRRAMINTINILLTSIAIADLAVMFSALIYTLYEKLIDTTDCKTHAEQYTWDWAAFCLFHSHFGVISHGTSLWLTVTVAAIRYVYMSLGAQMHGRELLSIGGTLFLVIGVLFVVLILQIPNYLSFHISSYSILEACPSLNFTIEQHRSNSSTDYFYLLKETELSKQKDCLIFKIVFWTNGIAFKLLPCFLMSVFIAVLVKVLREVDQRRHRLSRSSNKGGAGGGEHTTGMLIGVLAIFLLTELPQGLLALLTALYGFEFQSHVYTKLGDFLDFLSLTNSAVNFIIYCSMSQKFRQTFTKMFLPSGLKNLCNPRDQQTLERNEGKTVDTPLENGEHIELISKRL